MRGGCMLSQPVVAAVLSTLDDTSKLLMIPGYFSSITLYST